MSSQLRLTQLGLVACLAGSCYFIFFLMGANGTAELITKTLEEKTPLLPKTGVPVKTHYTGIGPIDHQLSILDVFFWALFDADRPEFSLHLNDFAFQFAVQFGLMVIEGSRPGNAGRIISYAAVWGGLAQNISIAMTLPLLFLTYLATSPTVHGASLSTILPGTAELVSLPISLVLGYFVPAAAINITMDSTDQSTGFIVQQNWIAIWQAFPLWVALIQQILTRIIRPFVETGTGTEKVNNNVEYLRTTYTFLKYLSAFGHIASYSLSLRTIQTARWFSQDALAALHPLTVWGPAGITPDFKVADIGEGSHLFLQFDRIFSSSAIVIWAYYMYTQTNIKKDAGLGATLWSILKTVVSVLAIGPAGAAVALMEARDEAVLAQAGVGRKKVI